MIIPIHGLKYHNFNPPKIGDEVLMIKEKENLFDPMAIAAYNKLSQKIGYIGARSNYNKKVYARMLEVFVIGFVWSIGKNQILVEIDIPRL